MGAPLVRCLFPDPVDIISDVHGEFDALHDLLRWSQDFHASC
jgi:hypothetical protein